MSTKKEAPKSKTPKAAKLKAVMDQIWDKREGEANVGDAQAGDAQVADAQAADTKGSAAKPGDANGGDTKSGAAEAEAKGPAGKGKGKGKKKAAEPKATASKAPKPVKAKLPKKPKKVSCLDAAAQLLTNSKEPKTCQELIDLMEEKGLWKSPGGKTPANTLYAAILREINTKGKDARFTKAERGKFSHTGKEQLNAASQYQRSENMKTTELTRPSSKAPPAVDDAPLLAAAEALLAAKDNQMVTIKEWRALRRAVRRARKQR